MYFVMSAEDVDGHLEPFLHAMCEDEGEARECVARLVGNIGLFGNDPEAKPGLNDGDKWANRRWDGDGLTAWNWGVDERITVMAKYLDMTRLEAFT